MLEPSPLAAQKKNALTAALLIGDQEGFRTREVETLTLDFEGIIGDHHAGFTRKAGGREPWYTRGTWIKSGRQISLISVEELTEIAQRLRLDTVDPALIGANVVLSGLPFFSYLPAGTRLFFEGGACLVIEAMNGPCRFAGKALADAHPGKPNLELDFVAAARRRRGLVASVEHPGIIHTRTPVTVRIPEQWLWQD